LSLYKAIAMLGKLKYTGILSGMGVGQGGGMAESEGSLRFKITKAENAIFRQLSLYIATQQKTERERAKFYCLDLGRFAQASKYG
jgi:hypothetical protein